MKKTPFGCFLLSNFSDIIKNIIQTNTFMKKRILIKDKLQKGSYFLTERIGKNFDKEFKPELTPKEMLQLGVFGGRYFDGYIDEYPKSWFKKAKLSEKKKDVALNYFKINASQSHKIWIEKGWIDPADPRGWFQWYCRYYYGRRLPEEDQRQIKRWKGMKRHIGAIKKNCKKRDLTCRIKQRQALLHWAYDSRKI